MEKLCGDKGVVGGISKRNICISPQSVRARMLGDCRSIVINASPLPAFTAIKHS